MDRTVPTILHRPTAVTVLALPISLAGLIRLKLRQFLLSAPLDLLGFFEGEAKIVETGPIERPVDLGNVATLRHAVDANKLDRDDHL